MGTGPDAVASSSSSIPSRCPAAFPVSSIHRHHDGDDLWIQAIARSENEPLHRVPSDSTSGVKAFTNPAGLAAALAALGGVPTGAGLGHNRAVPDPRAVLRAIPLFSGLPERAIADLFSIAHPRSVRARAVVVDKGEPGAQLFVVTSGRLKVVTPGAEGADTTFSILGPGDVFGEIALLDGHVRSARVTAIEPCHLIVIDREPFLAFLRNSPDLAIGMLAVLARRVRVLSERAEDAAFLDVPARLAKQIVKLAERYGEPTSGGLRVALRISQHELGELVGATRESVNKHLAAWGRKRIVARESGRLIVRDLAALRMLGGGRPR